MTDIMNTPLIKLKDKGYNCFSQRTTTVRQELGGVPGAWVTDVMDAIEVSFEKEFDIGFQREEPDAWEQETTACMWMRGIPSRLDFFP